MTTTELQQKLKGEIAKWEKLKDLANKELQEDYSPNECETKLETLTNILDLVSSSEDKPTENHIKEIEDLKDKIINERIDTSNPTDLAMLLVKILDLIMENRKVIQENANWINSFVVNSEDTANKLKELLEGTKGDIDLTTTEYKCPLCKRVHNRGWGKLCKNCLAHTTSKSQKEKKE